MTNQTLLQKIIANIKSKVNSFAFNRMQYEIGCNPEQVLYEMRTYGYENLGEYARQSFISRLFTRRNKISATTHYRYFY